MNGGLVIVAIALLACLVSAERTCIKVTISYESYEDGPSEEIIRVARKDQCKDECHALPALDQLMGTLDEGDIDVCASVMSHRDESEFFDQSQMPEATD